MEILMMVLTIIGCLSVVCGIVTIIKLAIVKVREYKEHREDELMKHFFSTMQQISNNEIMLIEKAINDSLNKKTEDNK